jgi:hypothetical protein
MNKYEYERAKPMIWGMFAAASLACGNKVEGAAKHADEMAAQFEKRFPVEAEPDYPRQEEA